MCQQGICKPHVSWTALSGPAVHTSQPAWSVCTVKERNRKQTEEKTEIKTETGTDTTDFDSQNMRRREEESWCLISLESDSSTVISVTMSILDNSPSWPPRLSLLTFQMLTQLWGERLAGAWGEQQGVEGSDFWEVEQSQSLGGTSSVEWWWWWWGGQYG